MGVYKKASTPPSESNTKHLEISVSYFFLHDCFGICMNLIVKNHIL